MDNKIINDTDNNRFVISMDGEEAELTYEISDGVMALPHTYVPPVFEGKGVASSLAKTALDYARTEGLKVLPICSFIVTYIQRHPEYQDLLADEAE